MGTIVPGGIKRPQTMQFECNIGQSFQAVLLQNNDEANSLRYLIVFVFGLYPQNVSMVELVMNSSYSLVSYNHNN